MKPSIGGDPDEDAPTSAGLSEDRFRNLVESPNIIAWELDAETFVFNYVSPRAEEILGYPVDEWFGVGFWAEHIHPDDRDWAVDFCVSATARREDHEFEYRMITADGEELWLRDIVTVHTEPDGSVLLRGVMIDISEQKSAERAAGESNARFRDFAEAAQDYFWEMDADLRFSFFSDRFTEISGVPQETLLGKTREETGVPGVDPNIWTTHLDNLANHRPFRNFVHSRAKDDGSTVWLSINGRPIFDAEGQFTGYRGSASDITDRMTAEQALVAAKEEADLANRTKSEFLAHMSHELRTPLNSIIGFAEILDRQMFGDMGDQRYVRYARDIRQSGRHLLDLINDLLDVARIEAGQLQLSETELDLPEIIQACTRMVETRAADAGVSVLAEAPVTLPKLYADEVRMKQVVLNLLDNAIKYSPAGGAVTVRAHTTSLGGLEVRVSDTGVGMASTEIPRALEPFQRLEHDAHVDDASSVGLGLALVKALVEGQGGLMEVQSTLGKGTTVRVTFPPERART